MLRLLTKARRPLVVWLAAAAAALGMLAIPSVATASSTSPLPYFVEWQPGTPLPAIPAGYHIQAWPSQQTLAGLSVGQSVPTTTVDGSGPTAVQQSALQPNAAGIVTLEITPDVAAAAAPNTACGIAMVADLGSQSTNVLQSYSTISGVTQKFTYGKGQSSSLGVGLSPSGAAGSFSADGTTSVSTDAVQGFVPQYGRSFNHFETYFEIGEYYDSCFRVDYVHPFQWNAGTKYVHPSGAPGATHCSPEHPGDTFTKSDTSATTFSGGFNVPAVNFTGSAHTGYSGTASIEFDFSVSGQLCGTLNTPPNSPGVLVAS